MHTLIKDLEHFFAKAPHLPEDFRSGIVSVAPYFAIVGIVLLVPAVFGLFGLGFITVPFRMMGTPDMMMGGYGGFWMLAGIFALINLILLILAFPGLKARTEKGWTYVFYTVLVGAVRNLLSFNLMGFVIFTILGLYFLFEIKSHYHAHHEHGA